MEELVYYNELYDFYGELLTEKQKKYFEDYYFQNLSFREMADLYQVSRNAVFKQIHIVLKKLEEYEEILHLKEKKDKIMEILKDSEYEKKIEELL